MNKHCICKVRDIHRAVSEFEKQLGELFGLNLNETVLLCLLSEKGCLKPGIIAEELRLSNSNASKVICSLEDKGFISRTLCKEDKRCMTFSLTKNGQRMLGDIDKCDKIVLPENL